jgi:ABC-type lipoprotein export system ATPase subunit
VTGGRIDVSALTVAYRGGTAVLRDVDMAVERGSFLALQGPSGCGKSTLLNTIAGFVRPVAGEVLFNNAPVTRPGRERGVVFQRDVLFPWASVQANIGFALRATKVPRAQRRHRIVELLEKVGLAPSLLGRLPHELSGGMRQRVGIARALAGNPEVLLMDQTLRRTGRSDPVADAGLGHRIMGAVRNDHHLRHPRPRRGGADRIGDRRNGPTWNTRRSHRQSTTTPATFRRAGRASRIPGTAPPAAQRIAAGPFAFFDRDQNMTARRARLMAMPSAFACVTCGCGAASRAGELTVAWVVDPSWSQVPVAVDLGYSSATGLKVTVVPFLTGAAALEALVGGAVDIANGGDVPTAAAALKNPRLRIVADGSRWEGGCFVARRSSGVSSVADLAGRRIAVPLGSGAHYFATKFLSQAGFTTAAINTQLIQIGCRTGS